MPETLAFFTDLLEGEQVAHSEGWIELAWEGGGHLRLEPSTTAGITRLEFEAPGFRSRTLEIAGTRVEVNPSS